MAKKNTKRKQKTELQKAYQKERRRLQSAKRRAEKQGYVFPENVIPDMPKRVTRKALEKIQQTKPKDLYEKAKWISETGEEKTALERREEVKKRGYEKRTFLAIERKKVKQLAKQTEQEAYNKAYEQTQEQGEIPYYPTFSTIEQVRDLLSNLERKTWPFIDITERKNGLIRIFEDTVTQCSENLNVLEDYLKQREGEISDQLTVISWDSDSNDINASFVNVGVILNMGSLSRGQAESLSEMSEYFG